MSSVWSLINKIFHLYTQFFLKITTFIGCFFIYSIGIFLGHILYIFSPKPHPSHWLKSSKLSSPEAMF